MYVLTHVDSMLLLMVNRLERERVLLRRSHGCVCSAGPRVMNAVAGTGCFAPSTSPRLSHSVSVLHGHTKRSKQSRLNITSTSIYLLRLDPIILIRPTMCNVLFIFIVDYLLLLSFYVWFLLVTNLFSVWTNEDSINCHILIFYNNTVIFVRKICNYILPATSNYSKS